METAQFEIEEIRWLVVKAILDEDPALRKRVLAYFEVS
jgi:hypothetical protein